MKVKELIEKLSKMDGGRLVYFQVRECILPVGYLDTGELYDPELWDYKSDNCTIDDYFDGYDVIKDKIADIVVIG